MAPSAAMEKKLNELQHSVPCVWCTVCVCVSDFYRGMFYIFFFYDAYNEYLWAVPLSEISQFNGNTVSINQLQACRLCSLVPVNDTELFTFSFLTFSWCFHLEEAAVSANTKQKEYGRGCTSEFTVSDNGRKKGKVTADYGCLVINYKY